MTAVEHRSGKGAGDENFPVASWLIAAKLRPHVMAFYRFARTADDIADAPNLSPHEKLARLDHMAEGLEGEAGNDVTVALRHSLHETGVSAVHCHQLLDAFRQDAVKSRYASWAELMDYCALSAAPVGRFMLDLHGQSKATWTASDALCAALQVINHLQDCGDDYRQLDRVYLPEDWMAAEGAEVADLAPPPGGEGLGWGATPGVVRGGLSARVPHPRSLPARGREVISVTPGLRRVLDRTVAATEQLLAQGRALPGQIDDHGLKAEVAVILSLAERLLDRLGKEDPLAHRVSMGPIGLAAGVLRGLWRAWR